MSQEITEIQEQIEKDWTEKELVKFPTIEIFLKDDRKKQRKLKLEIENEMRRRDKLETEKKLHEFDLKLDIKNFLNSNKQYLRKKNYTSSFFGPIVMNKILNDISKATKSKVNDKNINNKEINSVKKLIDSLNRFSNRDSCDRFVKNTRNFNETEFRKRYKLLGIDYESELANAQKDSNAEEEAIEELKLPLIDKHHQANNEINHNQNQNNKKSHESLPPIQKATKLSKHDKIIEDVAKKNCLSPIESGEEDEDDVVNGEIKSPVIKPKKQQIDAQFLKNSRNNSANTN